MACWSRFICITRCLGLEYCGSRRWGSCGKPQQHWHHDACGPACSCSVSPTSVPARLNINCTPLMLFHIQATTYTLLMLSRVHMRPLVHCMQNKNDTNHVFLYKEVICPPTNKKSQSKPKHTVVFLVHPLPILTQLCWVCLGECHLASNKSNYKPSHTSFFTNSWQQTESEIWYRCKQYTNCLSLPLNYVFFPQDSLSLSLSSWVLSLIRTSC